MKILNQNTYLLTLLLSIVLISFTACVEDDDFDPPNSQIIDPVFQEGTIITNIGALASILAQEQGGGILDYSDENTTYTYSFENQPNVLEAYVVSSDEGGNFFEEIILQDNFENPTVGIKLLLDVNPLFIRYDVGRKVFIKLNDPQPVDPNNPLIPLTVGITNGVLTLGIAKGNEVDKISPSDEFKYIFRSSEKQDIVPLPISITEFSEAKTNLFVQLQDMQFNRNQAGVLTYAAGASDLFDGERTLESCTNGSSVVFSTSTFADFKSAILATGRGAVNGILTRNFEGDTFNVVVNTLEGVQLDNADRCDPDFDFLECTTPAGGGSTVIFSEDFESFTNFNSEGWTNVNINGGATEWIQDSFSENTYAQISGFNANESPIQTWLVSPAINMDSTSNEELRMNIQTNFNNGDILSIWVSTDFTGDPSTATWQALDTTIPAGSSSDFGSFESVGPVNISCLEGDFYLGFFYEGADPGPTTRYHIDDIEITGN